MAIIFLIGYLDTMYLNNKAKDIKDNIQFGDAYVNFVRDYAKGASDWYVFYDYTVNGKVITNSRAFEMEKYSRNKFICKHFPVVYSSKHADNSDILVTHEDSIKYGIISVWGELQKLPTSK